MSTQELLSKIFGGKTLEELDSRYKCVKCKTQKSSWKELHPHHVTYKPHLVKYLCERCHARITYLNSLKASEVKQKLTSEMRMKVWSKFMKEVINKVKYDASLSWFNNFCKRVNG
jgi:hypothetical protein